MLGISDAQVLGPENKETWVQHRSQVKGLLRSERKENRTRPKQKYRMFQKGCFPEQNSAHG
jgi:hypothetical protein